MLISSQPNSFFSVFLREFLDFLSPSLDQLVGGLNVLQNDVDFLRVVVFQLTQLKQHFLGLFRVSS